MFKTYGFPFTNSRGRNDKSNLLKKSESFGKIMIYLLLNAVSCTRGAQTSLTLLKICFLEVCKIRLCGADNHLIYKFKEITGNEATFRRPWQ